MRESSYLGRTICAIAVARSATPRQQKGSGGVLVPSAVRDGTPFDGASTRDATPPRPDVERMSCSALQTMLRQERREVDERRCGGGLHRKLGNSVRYR